ncbi:MAG TPA: hypothetical protein PLN79_09610, partial [bacterium]|nr:hypothetical protein [bacterium]
MQRIVLILIAGIFTTGFQSGSTLVGYHAKIRTTVYEDLSVARAIELSMDADLKEAVKYKKDFFRKNGYELIEKNENDRLTIVAQKVFPTASHRIEKYEDDLSAITVEKEGLRFSYREDFYTKMFKEEIERSDLRNDLPVAKMLMADTKFEFYITLPGKIDSLNSGEFDKAKAALDAAQKKYTEYEKVYNRKSADMLVVMAGLVRQLEDAIKERSKVLNKKALYKTNFNQTLQHDYS